MGFIMKALIGQNNLFVKGNKHMKRNTANNMKRSVKFY